MPSGDDRVAMRFLVATDGSEESERAVEHAATNAVAHVAALSVVHIVPEEPAHGARDARTDDDLDERGERILRRARERAAEVAETQGADVPVDTELRTGRPASAIMDYAEEVDADGLFLGHRVLPAQREAVVGSVAKDILDTATMPVTIVP